MDYTTSIKSRTAFECNGIHTLKLKKTFVGLLYSTARNWPLLLLVCMLAKKAVWVGESSTLVLFSRVLAITETSQNSFRCVYCVKSSI